jgi:valyl-tRNA synthetase
VQQGSGLYLRGEAWIEASAELIQTRRHRLEQQRTEKTGYLKSLQAKLANDRFVASAPAAVVQETRDRQAETLALLERLETQLQSLS